jgi:hypothetical protein
MIPLIWAPLDEKPLAVIICAVGSGKDPGRALLALVQRQKHLPVLVGVRRTVVQ